MACALFRPMTTSQDIHNLIGDKKHIQSCEHMNSVTLNNFMRSRQHGDVRGGEARRPRFLSAFLRPPSRRGIRCQVGPVARAYHSARTRHSVKIVYQLQAYAGPLKQDQPPPLHPSHEILIVLPERGADEEAHACIVGIARASIGGAQQPLRLRSFGFTGRLLSKP